MIVICPKTKTSFEDPFDCNGMDGQRLDFAYKNYYVFFCNKNYQLLILVNFLIHLYIIYFVIKDDFFKNKL